MYLHSVYIHWNIWLNELFYMINLHRGSLLPTQALNLLKVAKSPAKWCHSEKQRVRENKLHTVLAIQECSCDLYKTREMILSDFIWEIFVCFFVFVLVFFGGGGSVYYFPTRQLKGKLVVFRRQTLVSRRIPICSHAPGSGVFWTSSSTSWLCGPISLSCANEQEAMTYLGDTLFQWGPPLCMAS